MAPRIIRCKVKLHILSFLPLRQNGKQTFKDLDITINLHFEHLYPNLQEDGEFYKRS